MFRVRQMRQMISPDNVDVQSICDLLTKCGIVNDFAVADWYEIQRILHIRNEISSVLDFYFQIRSLRSFTTKDKNLLGPLLQSNLHLIEKKPDFTDILHVTMMRWNALIYMAQDFPEMAEAILYSENMDQLNEDTAEFCSGDVLIENKADLNLMKMEANCLPHEESQKWWRVIDTIETINETEAEREP